MAINKSFVIKNGVQVSTDLIIGDADNNRVGIGTTIPFYDLHVGRGRKSRGGIGATDLVVTGVATVTNLDVTLMAHMILHMINLRVPSYLMTIQRLESELDLTSPSCMMAIIQY